MAKKLDTRPHYIKEQNRSVEYMGYTVNEAGEVYNSRGRRVKPKFLFKGKKIDYIYLDVTYAAKKRRISYHKFVYMAWHPEFIDDGLHVITTKGRRFDYSIKNLKTITRKEHLEILQKGIKYTDKEKHLIVETYLDVKDDITLEEFASKVDLTVRTLSKYIEKYKDGI